MKNKAFSRNKTQKHYCKNVSLWCKKIVHAVDGNIGRKTGEE